MPDNKDNGYNPFRRPKFAALERLVCSYLIESLNASPLESILYICRGAQLLTDTEIQKLNLDMESINSVYTVAQRLNSAKPLNQDDQPFYTVFTETLDFENEIEPWRKMKAYNFYVKTPFMQTGNSFRRVDYEEDEIDLDKLDTFDLFNHSNRSLTPPGYAHLVSDFLEMAVPFAQTLGGILTQLISPQTYSDMLMVYKGGRHDSNQ